MLIKAEERFNPLSDLDFESIRFGASEEVNFGKGARVMDYHAKGADVEVVFSGEGNGFAESNFAGKMIGKGKDGEMVFGFSRLPWVNYNTPILSSRKPVIELSTGKITVKTENFGQVKSKKAKLNRQVFKDGEEIYNQIAKIAGLGHFDSTENVFNTISNLSSVKQGDKLNFKLTISSVYGDEVFEGEVDVQ